MPPKNNRRRRRRKRSHHPPATNTFPSRGRVDEEADLSTGHVEDTPNQKKVLASLFVDRRNVYDEFFILGEGSFGLVTLGILTKPDGTTAKVALKGANKQIYVEAMRREADVMARFDHPNVVRLMGVQRAPFKIIMEYMQNGDLLDALKRNVFPDDTDLMEILIQVASGMEYVSKMNYVHRDLACRNVFVDKSRRCKIGDFGQCRDVGHTGGVFKTTVWRLYNPYQAPEVMTDGEFTTKSDVWSMGLLAWELYLSSPREVRSAHKKILMDIFVLSGLLPKPPLCPVDLFVYTRTALMNERPEERPDFSNVKKCFCDIAGRVLLS